MRPSTFARPVAAGALLVVAGELLLVAGCAGSAPGAADVPDAPPPPASSLAPAPTSAGPIPGLRPLTPAQRQTRELCHLGKVRNGCEFYSDDALRLQGIDPES